MTMHARRCTHEPAPPPSPPTAACGFVLEPSCPPSAPPCGLGRALAGWGVAVAGNGLLMRHVLDAARVEPGGTWALQDGVDLDGAFAEYLERPGVTQAYGRVEDAAEAFAEDELDLSPEEARRFAAGLAEILARALDASRLARDGHDPEAPRERS